MALIECPECHKDISDECKKCPQCGYTLKRRANKFNTIFKSIIYVFKKNKTYSFFKNKIKLSSLQILSLVIILCSFMVNISDRCFSRRVYPTGTYSPSQITLDNFHWALAENNNYIFIWYGIIISIILSIISILIYNSKFNKIKKKSLLYMPNSIYSILVLTTIVLANSDKLGTTFAKGHTKYTTNWGAYYVLITSVISVIILFIDIKNKRNDKNEKKNNI